MVVQGWHEAREQLWRQLRNGSARSRYERGDYLYTPDQPAHTLFLLTSGFVRLQIVSSEGRALTIRLVEPRQVFGHAALAGPGSYDSYAEALGAVEVYQVKRQELQLAIQRDPALSLVLIDELGQYCTTMSQRLDEVAFKSVPSRLASLLITMASDPATTSNCRAAPISNSPT
jgi:CRP-like cAMP-binding protein